MFLDLTVRGKDFRVTKPTKKQLQNCQSKEPLLSSIKLLKQNLLIKTEHGWRRVFGPIRDWPSQVLTALQRALLKLLDVPLLSYAFDEKIIFEFQILARNLARVVEQVLKALFADLVAALAKYLKQYRQVFVLELDLPTRVPLISIPQLQPTAPNKTA